MTLSRQFAYLVLLALPVACASWTVTHEEVFREPREFCKSQSQNCKPMVARKFFYVFTCEYCFSHYVSAFFLLVDTLSNALRGLARIPDRLVCPGLGRQHLYEFLQSTPASISSTKTSPSRPSRPLSARSRPHPHHHPPEANPTARPDITSPREH